MSKFCKLLIKGIPIGMSNTLPGISGGTIALVLKIYDELIESIKSLNFKFLIPIILGAVTGVFIGSNIIIKLYNNYPLFISAFLLGLILASVKVTYQEIDDLNIYKIILLISGFIIAFMFSVDFNNPINNNSISLIKYFSSGVLGSTAMILPGISGGTVLVMMGVYQEILTAISNLNILIITVFGAGVVVGLLVFSWFLSFLLKKYRSFLMAFLSGLIIGSIRSVIPSHINLSVIVGFILGVSVIYLILQVD